MIVTCMCVWCVCDRESAWVGALRVYCVTTVCRVLCSTVCTSGLAPLQEGLTVTLSVVFHHHSNLCMVKSDKH